MTTSETLLSISKIETFCYYYFMTEIKKKMWPESYEKILSGEKTYDIRLADWNIEPGNTLVFQEWNPKTKEYTGRELHKKVGHVGKTKGWEA